MVVMPMAAGKMEFFCRFFAARGMPSPVMAATGRRQPMMPVELGSTASCEGCFGKWGSRGRARGRSGKGSDLGRDAEGLGGGLADGLAVA